MPGGVSARLDHATRIRLASAERIFIERSVLYVVHGSIAGLTPTQALDSVLATTPLRSAVAGDGRIVVGPQ